MTLFKRWLAVGTSMAMLSTSMSTDLQAQGHAYHDGQNASIPTEWAFGGLLVLSMAILLLQKGNDRHDVAPQAH